MEGKALPDYGKVVDIVTRYALVEMVMPTMLGLLMPILIGVLFDVWVLAAYLVVLNIVAALFAIFQFNAGGALDNAKKYLEVRGLKRTPVHAAAVTGDTFGDPLKDTSGPSLHILIKLSNILGITLIPLFLTLGKLGENIMLRIEIAIAIIIVWLIIALIVRRVIAKEAVEIEFTKA